MNDERNKAIQLADRLDTLGLSLILKQTADELRRLHGENEVLRQFLRQISPQREWRGLTDEEMSEVMDYWSDPVRSAYGGAHSADGEYVGMVDTWRYIEAKLKEKNT